jgi:hypothetical protein
MSERWTARIARRPLLAGVLGIFGVGVAGGLVYEGVHLFGRRYPRTKYDDLLDQLTDRESAAKLGRTVIAQPRRLSPDAERLADTDGIARKLRTGAGKGSVSGAVAADIAAGKLVEIQGWVLPVSLALVAVIAAETSGAFG